MGNKRRKRTRIQRSAKKNVLLDEAPTSFFSKLKGVFDEALPDFPPLDENCYDLCILARERIKEAKPGSGGVVAVGQMSDKTFVVGVNPGLTGAFPELVRTAWGVEQNPPCKSASDDVALTFRQNAPVGQKGCAEKKINGASPSCVES